ncbi:MAG: hypothetical protein R3E89_01425 [Thiolinea sp.]
MRWPLQKIGFRSRHSIVNWCVVASYALELFSAVADLDTVYVPIGCGSGTAPSRHAMPWVCRPKWWGVARAADAAKRSFDSGQLSRVQCATCYDGVAVRVPVAEAFEIMRRVPSALLRSVKTKLPRRSACIIAVSTIWPKVPVLRRWPHCCRSASRCVAKKLR